ncbi:MAG: transporter, partial [Pseudomonadota bacterium]|nr:transporter [Pseudomonadota bacterium]
HAGPPFVTDDPGPVERHHAEINLIYQETRADAGRAGALAGELNYGCARETQCHVALPVAINHPAGGSVQTGIGDVELGVKYRFLDQTDSGWSAAVYPTVFLPTGDASRGLGNGRAQLLLPLWVQRSFGPWSWDAGAAYLVNPGPGARDTWFTGLLGQRSFGDRLTLGAELFHRSSSAPGEPASCGFNVGAIANLAPQQSLLLSVGRGLSYVSSNQRSVFLAYQLAL